PAQGGKDLRDIPMKLKVASFTFRGPTDAEIPDERGSTHVDFVMWSYPRLGEGKFGEVPKYSVHATRRNPALQQTLKEQRFINRRAQITTFGANEGVYTPPGIEKAHSFKVFLGGYLIDMQVSTNVTQEEMKTFFSSLKMTDGPK